jgi:hypothetical protein
MSEYVFRRALGIVKIERTTPSGTVMVLTVPENDIRFIVSTLDDLVGKEIGPGQEITMEMD